MRNPASNIGTDWRNKTLEVLENHYWGDPESAPTNLVKKCIELSRVPVCDFSVEDLRMMIGQQFGLLYLIPLAIEKLTGDIFVEGDLYRGDLLQNVLKVNNDFWQINKDLWLQVDKLISHRKDEIVEEIRYLDKFYSKE